MNRKEELNAVIKECITTALINQMHKKPIDEVAITELVKDAGVSRISFYRNFESKRDVLEKHLLKLISEWGAEFEDRNDINYFYESLLKHYYKYKDFYLLLYRQGLSNLIYENIRSACKVHEAQSSVEGYMKALFAGSIFGWVDEWMRNGMADTPEEIFKLIETANQIQEGGQNEKMV